MVFALVMQNKGFGLQTPCFAQTLSIVACWRVLAVILTDPPRPEPQKEMDVIILMIRVAKTFHPAKTLRPPTIDNVYLQKARFHPNPAPGTEPCKWVKPGRFGSFFVLCFLALGGYCLQMLCLPGFGTHANTLICHISCFPF